jgi:hypothetical protein
MGKFRITDDLILPPGPAFVAASPAYKAEHQFPAGLWLADTDEIAREKVWKKTYTISIPTKEIDMLPSGDIDAYTDRSHMGGRSGVGSYILHKTDGRRTHFCSLRGNTKQATVFQSESLPLKPPQRPY